jgi:hypothetical protein
MMRAAGSNKSLVCANCGECFTAPAHSGRYRQTSERRIKSARYCSRACRQAAYVARRAARADVPHSERHKAFRGRVTDVGSRVKSAGGADLVHPSRRLCSPLKYLAKFDRKIRPWVPFPSSRMPAGQACIACGFPMAVSATW